MNGEFEPPETEALVTYFKVSWRSQSTPESINKKTRHRSLSRQESCHSKPSNKYGFISRTSRYKIHVLMQKVRKKVGIKHNCSITASHLQSAKWKTKSTWWRRRV